MSDKFSFDVPFQWQIIKYTIKDKHGYKALLLYKYEYFDVLDQQVIARALQKYFKRKHRVPSTAAVLNEELNTLFKSRDYAQLILAEDQQRIKRKIRKLYKGVVKEGDEILHKCKLFASFVEFKKVLEDVDLHNFSGYESYAKNIQKAINLGMEIEEVNAGSFIVAGHQARITDRYNREDIVPTPYRQMNQLTNAGGYEKGSVVVLMDRPKKGKTLTLVNLASAYVKRRKKVIYFDLENGETQISIRVDQATIGKLKSEILSHNYDDKLKKVYRQYRRFGGELFVKRMPAMCTVQDLQKTVDELYTDYGIKFDIAIVDYIALMGSSSGSKEDFQRISDAYVDIKNWAKTNAFDIVFSANHVIRAAYKKRYTKYDPEDLAKCIDIERHIDALYGIQQSKLDEELGIYRFEVIEQRDGFNYGRILFHANIPHQTLRELSKEEEDAYNKQLEAMGEEGTKRESLKDKSERVKAQTRTDL